MKLLKVKTGGIENVEPIENSFGVNNVYWKLPPENDNIRWNYTRENDTYVRCSSYWTSSQGSEKTLVFEREIYNTQEMLVRFEKSIEFYKKNQGLTKIELYGKSDKKLMMENRVTESGIAPSVQNEKFLLK